MVFIHISHAISCTHTVLRMRISTLIEAHKGLRTHLILLPPVRVFSSLRLTVFNTNSHWLKVIQGKGTETTSGVGDPLIALCHIVLSNTIHGTHLGENLRRTRSHWTAFAARLLTFPGASRLSLLSPPLLNHPGSRVYLLFLFFSSFVILLKVAVTRTCPLAPTFVLSPLCSSDLHGRAG